MHVPRRGWQAVILLALLNTLPGADRLTRYAHAGQPAPAPCPWGGIYPAVLTPFRHGGGVDVTSLERQLHYQLQGGVHGVLVLSTHGEGQYLTPEERAQVVSTAVRAARRKVPVVVGVHACDVEAARAQVIQAKHLGAAAVLVEYAGNPRATAKKVRRFFADLAEAHALPIFYCHAPAETGLKLSAADVAGILGLDGVAGVQEGTLNLGEVRQHVRLARGTGKAFFSATAVNLTQFMDLGGHGAMCPEATLLPCPTGQAYNAYVRGRHEEARSIQEELFEVTPIVRGGGSPALVRTVVMCAEDHKLPLPMDAAEPQARLKAALNSLGVPTTTEVRRPLPALTGKDVRQVETAVYRINRVDWCEAALRVAPAPLHTCPREDEEEGGMLLKTGAFQLGPGVTKDLLRSQGDGQGGFWK